MEASCATSGTWLFNSSGLFCSVLYLEHTFLFGGMFLWTDLHLKKSIFIDVFMSAYVGTFRGGKRRREEQELQVVVS